MVSTSSKYITFKIVVSDVNLYPYSAAGYTGHGYAFFPGLHEVPGREER